MCTFIYTRKYIGAVVAIINLYIVITQLYLCFV